MWKMLAKYIRLLTRSRVTSAVTENRTSISCSSLRWEKWHPQPYTLGNLTKQLDAIGNDCYSLRKLTLNIFE